MTERYLLFSIRFSRSTIALTGARSPPHLIFISFSTPALIQILRVLSVFAGLTIVVYSHVLLRIQESIKIVLRGVLGIVAILRDIPRTSLPPLSMIPPIISCFIIIFYYLFFTISIVIVTLLITVTLPFIIRYACFNYGNEKNELPQLWFVDVYARMGVCVCVYVCKVCLYIRLSAACVHTHTVCSLRMASSM